MNQGRSNAKLQRSIEKAQAVKEAHAEEIMSKANVVGVGVGFCQKGGIRTDTVGLVVMVNKKIPGANLAPEDLLPEVIDGIPVDIQEVGEIKAQ